MRETVVMVVALMMGAPAFAQSPPPVAPAAADSAAPAPAAPRAAPRQGPKASPEQYPFKAILAQLQKDPLKPGSPASKPSNDPREAQKARLAAGLQEVGGELLADTIPPSARSALEKADAWKQELQIPAAGKDGRVLYTFGEGQPTVVCAPLRICLLELQQGEQVVGEPHIGDSVRWTIAPAMSGAGNAVTTMVIIRPKESGLDTVLVIPTNRRMYYVRLLSRQQEYLPMVAFTYPDDQTATWREFETSNRERTSAAPSNPFESLANLNFDYELAGGSEFLRPVRVADDGRKTYIQMPPGTAVREAPILVVTGLDSNAEQVNYRAINNVYIVDRLFEHGALLLGGGRKKERVDIIRGAGGGSGRVTKDSKQGDSIEATYMRMRQTPRTAATGGSAVPNIAKPADRQK